MEKSLEIKLMIIENFIDHHEHDEAGREIMKQEAALYVEEDHVDEIAEADSFSKFLGTIDWPSLRQQKLTLLNIIEKVKVHPIQVEDLDGIVHFLDGFMDLSVDKYGLSEDTVFNLPKEEEL